MAQDLRKLFEMQRKEEKYNLKDDHEQRFLERLEEALPQKHKPSLGWLKIAASVLVLLSIGFFAYQQFGEENSLKPTVVETNAGIEEVKGISLGDLSPDLKKVETYYVANINLELSKLEVSEDNEALIDSFMNQLTQLNSEYERLNIELNEIGPNDQTIAALIQNLQLRLQLLQQLKKKLNQLKTSENEQVERNIL